MTEKTPIEKAAEDLFRRISTHHTKPYPEEIANIFRRRLENEVPRKRPEPAMNPGLAKWERIGHNQCRRAIGLTDKE